jgi:hypothetical protein
LLDIFNRLFARFSDRNVTLAALDNLKLLVKGYHDAGTPFFFGLGLHYPHQSWYACLCGELELSLDSRFGSRHVPTNITEMYPNAQDMPIAKHQNAPTGKTLVKKDSIRFVLIVTLYHRIA